MQECTTTAARVKLQDYVSGSEQAEIWCSTRGRWTGTACEDMIHTGPETFKLQFRAIKPKNGLEALGQDPGLFMFEPSLIVEWEGLQAGVSHSGKVLLADNPSTLLFHNFDGKEELPPVLVVGRRTLSEDFSFQIPEHLPFLYLYAPPGDSSSLTYEAGTVLSTSFRLHRKDQDGQKVEIKAGLGGDVEFNAGYSLGAHLAFAFDIKAVAAGIVKSHRSTTADKASGLHYSVSLAWRGAASSRLTAVQYETSESITASSSAEAFGKPVEGGGDLVLSLAETVKVTKTLVVVFNHDTCKVNTKEDNEFTIEHQPNSLQVRSIDAVDKQVIRLARQGT